jgi:hypothetical protein
MPSKHFSNSGESTFVDVGAERVSEGAGCCAGGAGASVDGVGGAIGARELLGCGGNLLSAAGDGTEGAAGALVFVGAAGTTEGRVAFSVVTPTDVGALTSLTGTAGGFGLGSVTTRGFAAGAGVGVGAGAAGSLTSRGRCTCGAASFARGAGAVGASFGCSVAAIDPITGTFTSAGAIPNARSTAPRIAKSCSKVLFADSAA